MDDGCEAATLFKFHIEDCERFKRGESVPAGMLDFGDVHCIEAGRGAPRAKAPAFGKAFTELAPVVGPFAILAALAWGLVAYWRRWLIAG